MEREQGESNDQYDSGEASEGIEGRDRAPRIGSERGVESANDHPAEMELEVDLIAEIAVEVVSALDEVRVVPQRHAQVEREPQHQGEKHAQGDKRSDGTLSTVAQYRATEEGRSYRERRTGL